VITRGYLLYGDFRQAEEAAQEALLAIYRQWDRVRLQTAQQRRQHVMKILISRHADHCRLQPLHAQAMTFALGSDGGVVQQVETDALANEVIQAIRGLPAQPRVIALMHWAEKIPLADIAQEMGISASAARTQLTRAQRALSTNLNAPDLAPARGSLNIPLAPLCGM
jgi:RNA polymerase sigma factor (sigma-70 family)